MKYQAAVKAASVFTNEYGETSHVVKLPYSDIHIVVGDEAYVAEHLPGARIVLTLSPTENKEDDDGTANDTMVAYMVEVANDVIGQYADDRREYANEEVYNYWIYPGRRAILSEVSGWIDNEIARLDGEVGAGEPPSEGECEHYNVPETCEECQRHAALVERYARFRDESYDDDDVMKHRRNLISQNPRDGE